jgi:hypothetical protein
MNLEFLNYMDGIDILLKIILMETYNIPKYEILKNKDVIPIILSILALIVSSYAIWISRKSQNEATYFASIENQYNSFDKLADILSQNWELAHLAVLSERYDNMVLLIKQAVGTLSVKKQAEFFIREKIIAILIFQIYEKTLYLKNNYKIIKNTSTSLNNKYVQRRAIFIDEILNYFTKKLLRNPRLIYCWNVEKMMNYFEEETKEHYSKFVTNEGVNAIGIDFVGPFSE